MLSKFLGFGPEGWDLGLKAGIWASRLRFGPQGWVFGLKAGIWASRLEFEPQAWNLNLNARNLGLKAGI